MMSMLTYAETWDEDPFEEFADWEGAEEPEEDTRLIRTLDWEDRLEIYKRVKQALISAGRLTVENIVDALAGRVCDAF